MRVLLFLCVTTQQPASPPQPKRTVEFTGTVLMNGFYNSARTNNSDAPTFADSDAVGVKGSSATLRQTRLGATVTDPDVLGGSFNGEIDLPPRETARSRWSACGAPSRPCNGRIYS